LLLRPFYTKESIKSSNVFVFFIFTFCGIFDPEFAKEINKMPIRAYNKVVEEITVSERQENQGFIAYLYNACCGQFEKSGGEAELLFGEERAAVRFRAPVVGENLSALLTDKISEIVGVGYKYTFLRNRLDVCLGGREKKLLLAALIAADLDSDKGYIRRKLGKGDCAIDGVYSFRLAPLREKWERIAEYVPRGFGTTDLKRFCEFLVGESRNKIYIRGNSVYGENFIPLKRSRLTGEEDTETEIMLSDAGFVYCLGDVDDSVGDFLQKYYAERAIFS